MGGLAGARVVGESGAKGVQARECAGSGGKASLESAVTCTCKGRGVELGECAGWGGEKAVKGWMGVGLM